MRIADFDYDLPPDRIAQRPLAERDASRLLVLPRETGGVEHRAFRDLPLLLRPGDLLVTNRSRVLPARLLGVRPGGAPAEVLLLRDRGGDVWEALLRPGRRLATGARIVVGPSLAVEVLEARDLTDGRRLVHLVASAGTVGQAIQAAGHVPLPPYIRRPDQDDDRERYQTVYAREPGSVAAPTAGLHFTPMLLDALAARGVERAELLLHVGPATFRPVEVDDVSAHAVPAEPYLLPDETAQRIADARRRGGRVIAVGTTTTRVLETAARADGTVAAGEGETALTIVPGFRFRVVDALLTNFHLPRSSLLLLVAAFAGRQRVLDAYAQAVAAGYRFYSYGDAMLIA